MKKDWLGCNMSRQSATLLVQLYQSNCWVIFSKKNDLVSIHPFFCAMLLVAIDWSFDWQVILHDALATSLLQSHRKSVHACTFQFRIPNWFHCLWTLARELKGSGRKPKRAAGTRTNARFSFNEATVQQTTSDFPWWRCLKHVQMGEDPWTQARPWQSDRSIDDINPCAITFWHSPNIVVSCIRPIMAILFYSVSYQIPGGDKQKDEYMMNSGLVYE